ncbi:MAG: transcription factor S [Nanoarchaeota archaeon]|nr:transcription factor S [Nanoarchaeota archaeon]MBU1030268.1 transcription factor S [Nanoarchaeota archaeon]MBU1850713.1 transcription factor S [Nanoarchaeota archaeon]
MLFCPKCGSLLKPKTEKNKQILYCSCGFTNKEIKDAKIKEIVNKKEREVEVVSEEDQDSILPLTKAECPKCKHKKAYYWLTQTRAGDEPETKFFKCEKCKNVWRDYS